MWPTDSMPSLDSHQFQTGMSSQVAIIDTGAASNNQRHQPTARRVSDGVVGGDGFTEDNSVVEP